MLGGSLPEVVITSHIVKDIDVEREDCIGVVILSITGFAAEDSIHSHATVQSITRALRSIHYAGG